MSENREDKRYVPPEGSRVLVCGCMCAIVNISKSGLCLLFLDDISTDIPKDVSFDILPSDDLSKTFTITGELVWEREVPFSPSSLMAYTKVGILFAELSTEQQGQLEKLIQAKLR